jgi:protoheme IX farnesyltransferase
MRDPDPDAEQPAAAGGAVRAPGWRHDLAVLTKVRLNTFVLITTFFGFLLAAGWRGLDGWLLCHTLIGTAAAAFGSAAFNQLMEIELDARMRRTADRPLPSGRMGALVAFFIGWVLAGFGIIHLAAKVNEQAAYLAAATVAIYVFVYTPLKRISALNTLVGAIPGAIPPLIGWVAGGGGFTAGGWFLFALLFVWQLPHFVAINWLCREEYEAAGYRMWSNGDVSGRKTGTLAVVFSLALAGVSVVGFTSGLAGWAWLGGGVALALAMAGLAARFAKEGGRVASRRLFLFTLLYLPLALGLLAIAWN